jgi:tetratricopeptide (TPR) repeat protein
MSHPIINLYFCKKCKEIVDAKKASSRGRHPSCAKCKSYLFYFGRESAKISAESILTVYDESNEFNPLATYEKNVYTDLNKPYSPTDILECEDMLLHQPENLEALEFLAKHYASSNQLNSAERYALKLIKIYKRHHAANTILTDIYIYQKKHNKASLTLRNCLVSKKTSRDFERLGFCFLHMTDIENAFEAFTRSLKLATSKDSIRRITNVIEKLTQNMESK